MANKKAAKAANVNSSFIFHTSCVNLAIVDFPQKNYGVTNVVSPPKNFLDRSNNNLAHKILQLTTGGVVKNLSIC